MYARYEPKRHVYHAADAPRTRYGYRVKVLWVMAPDSNAAATISGQNLGTENPLRFNVDVSEGGKGTQIALDPGLGAAGEGGWKEFPSYVFFDRAGCFELRASSPERSWRIRFGFGR